MGVEFHRIRFIMIEIVPSMHLEENRCWILQNQAVAILGWGRWILRPILAQFSKYSHNSANISKILSQFEITTNRLFPPPHWLQPRAIQRRALYHRDMFRNLNLFQEIQDLFDILYVCRALTHFGSWYDGACEDQVIVDKTNRIWKDLTLAHSSSSTFG